MAVDNILHPMGAANGNQEARKMRDGDIRQVLDSTLRRECVADPDVVIRHELGLFYHQRRIDIAVLNGEFSGYEIKSDQDTLSRLEGQAELYGRVLDRVTLVATDRHIDKAMKALPKWWGLIAAREDNNVVILQGVRNGDFNPTLDAASIVHLLWRNEMLRELRRRGLSRGTYGLEKHRLVKILLEAMSLDEIRESVRQHIKVRPPLSIGPLHERNDENRPTAATELPHLGGSLL